MDGLRQVWAEVDLNTLRRNYALIGTYTKSELMPIVKADAYGHGVIPVVRTLREMGAKRFGVAMLEEALEVKEAFPDLSILILGGTPIEHSDLLVEKGIIPGIFRYEQAEALSQAALRQNKTATLHLKIDTGMGRIGFREADLPEIIKISKLPNLYIEGIFTHFATADAKDLTFAREQLRIFQRVYDCLKEKGINIPIRHAANSAAIIQLPEAHFEVVRPGIILYGLAPSLNMGTTPGLEPVLSWKARVSHIKTIQTGETVSYGRTFRAAYPTRVATIPLGYADGLRRALSNRGEVLVRGRRATMIGQVCMDQTMIDVSSIPGVDVGDVVTILGKDGIDAINATLMASWMNTISYEILCGISKRVPRFYIGEDHD